MNKISFDIRTGTAAPVTSLRNATLHWRAGSSVCIRGLTQENQWTTRVLDEPACPAMRAALQLLMALWDADAYPTDLSIGLDAAGQIVWLSDDGC